MRKSYYVVALAAIFFTQTNIFAQEHSCTVEFNERPGWDAPSNISDNGRWVAGMSGDDSSYLWNTMTKDYLFFQGESVDLNTTVYDITDDGRAVGAYLGASAIYRDGEWTKMESPEKWTGSTILSTTPDGSRMAGWGWKSGFKTACAWIDGTPFALKVPALDPTGKQPQSTSAEKISADGKTIIGFARNDMGYYGVGLIWRNFGEDPSSVEVEQLFIDSINTQKWLFYNILDISPNGKWIAGVCAPLVPVEDQPGYVEADPRPYRFNLETDELEIIYDARDIDFGLGDGGIRAVDNEGTVYITGMTQAANNPFTRAGYVNKKGEATQKLEDYIKNVYGGNEFTERLDYPGTVSAISADGKMLLGFGCWIDEDMGINPLEWLIMLDGTTNISGTEMSENPMKCFVNGKTLQLEGGVASVEVINAAGSVVYGSATNVNSISLEQLPAGIYAVRLSDGKEVKVQKIALGR